MTHLPPSKLNPTAEALSGVTVAKGHFKPFRFPWAFDAYRSQSHISHWTPYDVPMGDDVFDWIHKLSDRERNLLTQIFRFFTTGDVDVGQAYLDKYIPIFKNEEIRMMLTSFANMESTHADAYSLILTTIGMPDVEYQAFRNYAAMAAKHDYTSSFDIEDEADVAKALAVFSAFTEGMQLFSTFAILMSFARGNRPGGAVMTGMNQIVAYSIRDETQHVNYMTRLFRTYIRERPYLWTDRLKGDLYGIGTAMLHLEFDFIDLAYEVGDTPGCEIEDVKQYVRVTGNKRFNQIGLKSIFTGPDGKIATEHPLSWLDTMTSGLEHVNFFETRGTGYSNMPLAGSWANDVWAVRPSGVMVPRV